MKGKEITVGSRYIVRVSGLHTTVRVDALVGRTTGTGERTRFLDAWLCTNLATGRQIRVRSAQRFRSPAAVGELT